MNCDTLTTKELKRKILSLCVWSRRRIENRTEKWQHILELKACIIHVGVFLIVLWEYVICGKHYLGGEINFGWHHGGQNVVSGKENFEERVLKGVSNPGGHHGIAPLGKCHCTFLMPVFCLQFSRILFSTGSFGSKNLFQSILWCISLTASSQHFCHYRLESKTTAVDFFTLRTLLYPCWTQTSFHRLKWVQFPLTSNF